MNKFIFLILGLSGLLGLVISLYIHRPKPLIPTPPSDVTVIQTFHYPASFVKQIANDPDAGRKIFKEFCASCHDKQPVIDVNAPRINDKQAWDLRRQWGMDDLLKITATGIGAMPARGGCFECSDEQLREAIRYILKQSK